MKQSKEIDESHSNESRRMYRGYIIDMNPAYTREWKINYYHPDYDGAPDSFDRRCGNCKTVEDAEREIDELIDEEIYYAHQSAPVQAGDVRFRAKRIDTGAWIEGDYHKRLVRPGKIECVITQISQSQDDEETYCVEPHTLELITPAQVGGGNEMEPVKAVQDNDGHWYVVPNNMLDEFTAWANEDCDVVGFDDAEFDGYRTGGDLNLIQLYAKI